MSDSIIEKKSFDFAVRTVNLYKHLTTEKKSLFCQNSFYAVGQASVQVYQRVKEDKVRQISTQKWILHLKKQTKLIIG